MTSDNSLWLITRQVSVSLLIVSVCLLVSQHIFIYVKYWYMECNIIPFLPLGCQTIEKKKTTAKRNGN